MHHRMLLAVALLLAAPASTRSDTVTAPGQAKAASPPFAAPASEGKPAAHPSGQALAMSRALVPKEIWERLLDRSSEGLSEAVSRSLTNKGSKVPSDLRGSIRRELSRNLKYDSAVNTQAQELQKRFTQQEMESAAKFYSSPVGQKVLQQLPEAQTEVGNQLQEQLATVVPEIIQRVAPEVASPGGQGDSSLPQDGAPSGRSPSPGQEGTGTSP